MITRSLLLAWVLLLFHSTAVAWEFNGDAGAELRWFPNEPRFPGQSEDSLGLSLLLNGEARWRSENDRVRASIKPFLRLDSVDSERSHFDFREAYIAWEGDDWEILAGANKVFWGVTESRHLVDIINQTDEVEDPDQEQKLGQPMIRTLWQKDWGDIELYLMPWFRERTFPGVEGRLRTPLPVNTDNTVYESSAEQHHLDLALRWSHYFGDVDIGVHAFSGTGREPLLLPNEDGQSLDPFYFQVNQLGVDMQYTREAWLWKLELLGRQGWQDNYFAAVAGFEYTLYGLRESSMDLGLLFEYLYDGRAPTEPVTIYDDDLFLGTRLAFNDASDTSILAGFVIDRNDPEWFFNLEAERRLGQDWFAEARLRIFKGDREKDGLYAFDRDDYFQLRLSRYF